MTARIHRRRLQVGATEFARTRMTARLLLLSLLLACTDSALVAVSDTPSPLLHVEDSLGKEHFGGVVYVHRKEPGALQLLVRDPYRCHQASYNPARFAIEIAQRALLLYRPPALQRVTPTTHVRIVMARTHRLGPLIWTTTIGQYEFSAPMLRARAMPPPISCGGLPSLLSRGR